MTILTDRQADVLRAVITEPGLTAPELNEALKLNRGQARDCLVGLRRRGLVQVSGLDWDLSTADQGVTGGHDA